MSAVALTLLLQTSMLAAADGDSYDKAFQESTKSGRPLLVLVGADWCPACRKMKTDVIPALRKNGSLKEVAFATVDHDRQSKLAAKLMRGDTIPQLILFTKTGEDWKRVHLTGVQKEDVLTSLLKKARE